MSKTYHFGTLLIVAILVALVSELPAAQPPGHAPVGEVTVLSRNLYYGADLSPLTDLPAPVDGGAFLEIMFTVESVFAEVIASDYPARAAVFAQEIADTQPTLIGLQEVATFTTQPFGPDLQPIGEETVEIDFLAVLLDELAALDLHYEPVVIAPGTDAAMPGLFRYVRMIDHEVILARTDLPAANLKVSNPQWDVFTNAVVFETGGGEVHLLRSWAAIDGKVQGREFRLITTHLNAEGDNIQLDQMIELLEGPANTDMPVVMIGDYNSAAGGVVDGPIWSWPVDAYELLLDEGFQDAWTIAHPEEDGFTAAQASFLDNDESLAITRIDLVMIRDGNGSGAKKGQWHTHEVGLLGDKPQFITESTLMYPDGSEFTFPIYWPSDHVGLFARLQLQP